MEAFERSFTGLCGDYVSKRLDLFDDARKAGRVAYRAVDENLPIYLDNMTILREAVSKGITSLPELDDTFSDVLRGEAAEDFFDPSLYGKVIGTDGIALYNTLIGGYAKEDGEKVQGINEKINLFRQANRGVRMPLMTQLKKRILSDEKTFSFVPTGYNDDTELVSALKEASGKLSSLIGPEGALTALLSRIGDYDLSKIFVDRTASTTLSSYAYGSWHVVEDGLAARFDGENPKKAAVRDEKYEKAKDKYFKKHSCVSLSEMDSLAELLGKEGSVVSFVKTLTPKDKACLTDAFDAASLRTYSLIHTEYADGSRELMRNKHHNDVLKAYLDSALDIVRVVRALSSGFALPDKDLSFASDLGAIESELSFFTGLYNKCRSYLTSKPWEGGTEIPLSFGYGTFLSGWSNSKEKDNGGVILLRDGKYYLGVYSKSDRGFDLSGAPSGSGDCYEKIDVTYGADMSKTLPHVFFSRKAVEEGNIPEGVLASYLRHKNDRIPYTREEEVALIEYYASCCLLRKEWEGYHFSFRDSESYPSLASFIEDAQGQAFVMAKRPIDASFIDGAVRDGSLYLFQIYNRDFADGKHGKDRTFTTILRSLFDDRNLSDIRYQLGGNAGIGYRDAVLTRENSVVHRAGQPVALKHPKAGGPTERTFAYDIVKKKHYTEPALLLHLPVTLNYKAPRDADLNDRVNAYLRDTGIRPNIIGIRRGSRNLVYMVVIGPDNRIIEQRSLNCPKPGITPDFAMLLAERQEERQEERKNWQDVTEIRDMKKGYLSYVVSEIVSTMLRYGPCFVVIEDLSSEQKSRYSLDKTLYYDFEEALVRKLSYSLNKDAENADEPGSPFRALQLSCLPPTALSKHPGKQLGFVLFASGVNTDNADPVTGFIGSRLFIDTRMPVAAAREFIRKFDRIEVDANGMVRFDFDFMRFVTTVKDTGRTSRWSAYSYGTRTVRVRNRDTGKEMCYEPDLTEKFLKLFHDFNIDTEQGDLIPQFLEIEETAFWRGLLTNLMLLFRLRNEFGNGDDYLVSPVMGPDGRFFDSRRRLPSLPCCADANGAYHMALKGRLLLERIAAYDEEVGERLNLLISNSDWFSYLER